MQYWILKAISRILCLLPYRLLLSLGKGLGHIYYLAAKPQRQRAVTQIQERMNLSPADAEKAIRHLFINLAQTFLEVLYTPRLNAANIGDYVTIENRHYFDAAMAEGKGVAILAAHFGNWEWLGAALALNGYPLAAVFKGQPNDQHTRLITEYRKHVGMEVYVSDQNAGKTGITLDFFGKPSSTHSGISVFAAKLGCPVVPIFIVRRPEGGHRILVQPPHHFEHTGHQAEDITAFTAKMSKIIEDIIRQYPDHWIWFHKRWRDPHHGRPASGGDMQ
ncbi:MAG: lipid biosynthesis acyltransferase [Anaerosporomusa subterranea]|nr:lipid biosynthesis acyltransferase [Anaerosporomusa subterranea]